MSNTHREEVIHTPGDSPDDGVKFVHIEPGEFLIPDTVHPAYRNPANYRVPRRLRDPGIAMVVLPMGVNYKIVNSRGEEIRSSEPTTQPARQAE